MTKTIARRLSELQAALQGAPGSKMWVVIFDPVTGEPLEPIPPEAEIIIWIPDNNREVKDGQES